MALTQARMDARSFDPRILLHSGFFLLFITVKSPPSPSVDHSEVKEMCLCLITVGKTIQNRKGVLCRKQSPARNMRHVILASWRGFFHKNVA